MLGGRMDRMNVILRKCKSLSLSKMERSSSYSSLRSKSTRDDHLYGDIGEASGDVVAVLVGSSRRRYTINAKHLDHPLMNALIEPISGDEILVRCEVVLFDHLLWMLENAGADVDGNGEETLEELVQLYGY